MEEFDSKYKTDRFDVPASYFEDLDDKVLSRIRGLEQEKKRKGLSFSWGKPLTIAASIALIVTITLLSYRSAKIEEDTISFSDLDSMDIVYFENHEEFSDEEFEEIIPEAVIDTLYKEEIKMQYADTYISNEELEDLEEEYSILDDEIEI